MIRPDFSDIQKNGFRINQFRLVLSQDSKRFSNSNNESTGNIIEEKSLILCYLNEISEIYFTISYFSLRITFLFFFAAMLSLLSTGTGLSLTIVLALLSIIFFLIARRYRVLFILSSLGADFAESTYNAKINDAYNF